MIMTSDVEGTDKLKFLKETHLNICFLKSKMHQSGYTRQIYADTASSK